MKAVPSGLDVYQYEKKGEIEMNRALIATLGSIPIAAAAQQGPPVVSAEIVNDEANAVPAEIVNDEASAVPVRTVGRQPYQFTFDVTSSGGGEACAQIPIPEEKMLTITSVGVTSTTDGAALPEVWIRVTRNRPSGFSIFRFQDDLQFVSAGRWSGSFSPEVFGGTVVNSEFNEVNYTLAICAGPPDAPATFNDARGVVSGYVTDGGILDGALIAPF
jgi:hypothetical protein